MGERVGLQGSATLPTRAGLLEDPAVPNIADLRQHLHSTHLPLPGPLCSSTSPLLQIHPQASGCGVLTLARSSASNGISGLWRSCQEMGHVGYLFSVKIMRVLKCFLPIKNITSFRTENVKCVNI